MTTENLSDGTGDILIPPHVVSDPVDSETQDWGGYFPDPHSVKMYRDPVLDEYHNDRLRAIQLLSNEIKNQIKTDEFRVLDFGIGDGIELSKLGLPITDLIGIDSSPHILEFAKNNFMSISGRFLVGNEQMLIQVPDESVDLVVATNILGYLTDAEEMFFWQQVSRILVPNGSVLVTVGNQLFDLFALNSGTVEFFANEFDVPAAGSLLTLGTTKRFQNARRHNPLSFIDSMRGIGFSVVAQSFSQWHHTPPAILERDMNLTLREARAKARDNVFDPNSLPLAERWRNYFQCSVVGLLFQRI